MPLGGGPMPCGFCLEHGATGSMIVWHATGIIGSGGETNVSGPQKDKAGGSCKGRRGQRFFQIIGSPPWGRSENRGSGVGKAPTKRG